MSDPADSTALPISTVHADAQATECNATMITVGSGAVSLQHTGAPGVPRRMWPTSWPRSSVSAGSRGL